MADEGVTPPPLWGHPPEVGARPAIRRGRRPKPLDHRRTPQRGGGVTVLILAGGESSRMGSDKASLPWGDSRLIEHVGPVLKPIRSKNVARIVDFGVLAEGGYPYLATDFLCGETMAQLLN